MSTKEVGSANTEHFLIPTFDLAQLFNDRLPLWGEGRAKDPRIDCPFRRGVTADGFSLGGGKQDDVVSGSHGEILPPRVYDEGMRVRVDPTKCQGHNRCYALAPELFDVDDLGNAFELNDGIVPAGLEDKARLALANCPEFAISIEE